MKRTFPLVIILAIFWLNSSAQTIQVGQDSEQIKQLVEFSTRSHNKPDSYGNRASSRAIWDVKYQDGQVSEVIQCFYNQYLIDFEIFADYCKYYIMDNSKLSYILTQYENVSLYDLKNHFNKSYKERKIGEYYFSDGFEHFSKLYLHQNGLATVEWTETNLSMLPSNITKQLDSKIQAIKEEQAKYRESEEIRLLKEKEIKSKIYDLEKWSSGMYKQTILSQKKAILNYFKDSNNFPSYESIANDKIKYKRFKNTYNIHYKLIDNRTESQNYGSHVILGSGSITSEMTGKLISGTDEYLTLIKNASITIPTIEIESIEVMTEATINNLKVDFTRGLTEIKIKNKIVDFRKSEPEFEIQQKIANEIKGESNGRYLVKYEVSEIMGQTDVKAETEKITSKGGKTLKSVGGLALLGALLYFGYL